MKKLLLLASFLSFSAAVAEDFKLDDWQFTWRYKSVGSVSVELRAEGLSGALAVYLVKDKGGYSRDVVSMSPSTAVEVGEALSHVDEEFKKEQAVNGTAFKQVNAGEMQIHFLKTEKDGFYVDVSEKSVFRSVVMDRKTAAEISQHLKNSSAAINYMKSKLVISQ